jgi:hypothetical protein
MIFGRTDDRWVEVEVIISGKILKAEVFALIQANRLRIRRFFQ